LPLRPASFSPTIAPMIPRSMVIPFCELSRRDQSAGGAQCSGQAVGAISQLLVVNRANSP
jgi:hypothetical protein